MLRSIALASIASLLALTVGCSGAPDASPGDSTDDALSAQNGGYFVGVAPGLTGGISVHLANAKTTTCADGTKKSVCGIASVDYSALNLSSAEQTALDSAFKAGHAVIKGKLGMSNDGPNKTLPATFLVLHATAAWKGVAANAQAGDLDQVYLVSHRILNAMCAQNASCPLFNQQQVNVATPATALAIQNVSLDSAGSQSDLAAAEDEMKIGAEGLLVLGHDVTLVSNHNAETTRTLLAADFYLPVKAGGSHLTCVSVDCAQGMHCEMKGINGGAIPVCVRN